MYVVTIPSETISCRLLTCSEGVCGHEWCYICFAPFQRNEHGFLFCRHTPECSERDPFIDLIDPDRINRPPPAWPIPGRQFQRTPQQHPDFFPFVPPHLRRQNANAGIGGALPGNRPRPPPPPAFPFAGPLGGIPAINRGNMLRARRQTNAARAGGLPNPIEVIPQFEDLRL